MVSTHITVGLGDATSLQSACLTGLQFLSAFITVSLSLLRHEQVLPQRELCCSVYCK